MNKYLHAGLIAFGILFTAIAIAYASDYYRNKTQKAVTEETPVACDVATACEICTQQQALTFPATSSAVVEVSATIPSQEENAMEAPSAPSPLPTKKVVEETNLVTGPDTTIEK